MDQNETLRLLNEADWKTIQLKLLEYAMFKVRRLSWRTGRAGLLPRGLSPEDLVLQAIQKTFEAASPSSEPGASIGLRRWNTQAMPDLLSHLKAVVDSDVNHLVSSEEHRTTKYDAETTEYGDNRANPENLYLRREHETESDEDFNRFFEALEREFKDDLEVTLLLESYREQAQEEGPVKPAKVARDKGIPIDSVRNAMKRLRRKVMIIEAPLEGASSNIREEKRANATIK